MAQQCCPPQWERILSNVFSRRSYCENRHWESHEVGSWAETRPSWVFCGIRLLFFVDHRRGPSNPPPEAATHSGESSEPLAVMGPGQGFKLGYCSIPSWKKYGVYILVDQCIKRIIWNIMRLERWKSCPEEEHSKLREESVWRPWARKELKTLEDWKPKAGRGAGARERWLGWGEEGTGQVINKIEMHIREYVQNLKNNTNESIYKTETDIENKLMVTKGEREEG